MRLTKHQRRPRLELKLRPHPDNLHALYRESKDPVERARWHAIWLLATGHAIPQVAQTLGYSTCWVRDTLPRHNEGQPPLLPPELWEAFRQALLQPHPRDGIWTIRNAALWLSERLGRPVDPRRAWNWRKRLGFAPLPPTLGRDAFVRSSTGESEFWLLPPVSAGQRSYLVAFSEVLGRLPADPAGLG